MGRKPGSKQLILEFFLRNIGKVLESKEIQKASGGAVEWARRVRELRNEDGYQILSYKDRADLKPNQYLLELSSACPPSHAASPRKLAPGYLKETDTPARCAGSRPAIPTRSVEIERYG